MRPGSFTRFDAPAVREHAGLVVNRFFQIHAFFLPFRFLQEDDVS